MPPLEWVKLIGSLAGLGSLAWNVLWTINRAADSYLFIEISTQKEEASNRLEICPAVENKGSFTKKLEGAFLLIGPEAEFPTKTMQPFCPTVTESTDTTEYVRSIVRNMKEGGKFAHLDRQDNNGRFVLALRYFTEENEDVDDERLTCERTLDLSVLAPGIYAARFYLEPDKGRWWMRKRLHRVVQTTFEVQAGIMTPDGVQRASPPQPGER